VTTTGSVTQLPQPAEALFGAAPGPSPGQFYFGGLNGKLMSGRYDGTRLTVDTVTVSPSAQTFAWIAPTLRPDDGSLVSAYAMGLEGALDYWDGKHWSTIYEFPHGDAFCTQQWNGALFSTGPDQAIAVRGALAPPSVIRANGSMVTVEPVPASPSGLCSGAVIAGIGPVLGNGRGGFYRDGATGWVELANSDQSGTGVHVVSITPYAKGFVYGGKAGFAGQYLTASNHFCPTTQVASDDIFIVTSVGQYLFFINNKPDSSPAQSMAIWHPL
jgi:hypothetical protein